MKKRKRTRITVETERVLIISQRRNGAARCTACDGEARLLTVEEAAAVAGLKALDIYRFADAGSLHYQESAAGALLICAASLGDFLAKRNAEAVLKT